MANAILNFHFDYWHTSLNQTQEQLHADKLDGGDHSTERQVHLGCGDTRLECSRGEDNDMRKRQTQWLVGQSCHKKILSWWCDVRRQPPANEADTQYCMDQLNWNQQHWDSEMKKSSKRAQYFTKFIVLFHTIIVIILHTRTGSQSHTFCFTLSSMSSSLLSLKR